MFPHISRHDCLPGLRCAAVAFGLLILGGIAQAGEAGRIVFVSGAVHAGTRSVALDDVISEGDEIATGADGYVYMKTIDDGLLILRPSSRARIVAYHVDLATPANTRVKLELLSGVARSVSGKAVKQARQNFRFNTPVAAIGVRGTDFTVFTDQEVSNVTVLSGAIVVSGFSGSCMPGGGGPCEHQASRELAAGQVGQTLQVKRGQAVPQLLSGSAVAPDAVAPPRGDEPVGKAGSTGGQPLASGEPSIDAQKASNLLQQGLRPVVVAPLDPVVVVPVVPVVPVLPVEPPSQIVWGRWTAVLGQPANINSGKLIDEKAERVALNAYYAVFRTRGADWQLPQQGTAGFALRQSEAFIRQDVTHAMTPASLENGRLQVDFGKSTFSTAFDLVSGSERFSLQSQGVMTRDGRLEGNSQLVRPTNMAVSGALGAENNAAYVFSSRLDEKRIASGVTYWTK